MARSIRIEYEGAHYHVMARGNRREAIVQNEADRESFSKVLGESCERTGWEVQAWVLMTNHYHLFIKTPEANLVSGMGWLQNTYTRRYNVRNKQWGRLFGDRYKAVVVQGGQRLYYETLMDYIHLNAVRAGLVDVDGGESVRAYPWSSIARGYALAPNIRPAWMACRVGLEMFGFADTAEGRRQMVNRLDERARAEMRQHCGVTAKPGGKDRRLSHLREGWYWGSEKFAEGVLRLSEAVVCKERSTGYRSSDEQRAHGELAAETIVKRGLTTTGLTEGDLPELAGSDTRKVIIAQEIRQQTTVPLKWIAERLKMKSANNVSQLLLGSRRKSNRR